jgi:hypothetical protein
MPWKATTMTATNRGSQEDVVAAALRWERLRSEAARLKAERQGERCEFEDTDTAACWRVADLDRQGWPRDGFASGDWCEPCRRSTILHAVWRRVRRREQGAMRMLRTRAARLRDWLR